MTLPRYPRQSTKSENPWCAYIFMMCHRIGRPPTSTMGLGRNSVSSRRRVPTPPHSTTTFMKLAPHINSELYLIALRLFVRTNTLIFLGSCGRLVSLCLVG